MRKWIKRIILVVVLVVVAAGVTLYLRLNYLARKGIEYGGTMALGVTTTLESADVSILGSRLSLNGLRIGNLPGYQTDRLIGLANGRIACSIPSLFTDEVEIKEIILNSPELTIEFKLGIPPRSNLGDLLAALKSDTAETKKAPAGEQKHLRVGLIRITQPRVRFHLLAGQTANVTLPDIELTELRNADGTPLLLVHVFRQVIVSMGTSALRHAGGIVPEDLLNSLNGALATAGTLLQGGARVIEAGVGEIGAAVPRAAAKGAGAVIKGAGGVVQGILGPRKKDEAPQVDK